MLFTLCAVSWSLGAFPGHAETALANAATAKPAVSDPTSRGAAFDRNRNGHLDPAGREAALRAWREQRDAQRRAQAAAAAENAKAAVAARYKQQKVSPLLLEMYDRNRNGRLDPNEWEQHRQDMKKLGNERQAAPAASNPLTPAAPGKAP